MLNITVHGTGYVGLVTGACLAHAGNNVLCVDVDANKIDQLRRGIIPIYEPGLEEMVAATTTSTGGPGRLSFTTNVVKGVHHGRYQFIAVGTPPNEDGSADLKYVLEVARSIGMHMDDYKIVIDKSTVPITTADKVRAKVLAELTARHSTLTFDVVSNPEFLKEGDAIRDFLKPDRVVVGTNSDRAEAAMRNLYAPFIRQRNNLLVMDVRSAELTKYAANVMLATKISLMNELANIAERYGADIEQVRLGIGSDSRIGYSFIYPGCGYGGSCFPKDVNALYQQAAEVGYDASIIHAVNAVNERQKSKPMEYLRRHFGNDLHGRTIALWGLSFKPNTDDIRESPALTFVREAREAGLDIRAYDPQAIHTFSAHPLSEGVVTVGSAEAALRGASALVILTDWHEFGTADLSTIRDTLIEPVLVDGRNLFNPKDVADQGLIYYSIGRLPR